LKNWTPEHTKDIKCWFNIETYWGFEELTLIRFYHELWARTIFFKSYRRDYENQAAMEYFEKIFSGNPFLIEEERLGYMTQKDNLFQPPHFLLTTTDEIARLSILSMKRGMFYWDGDYGYVVNKEFEEKPVSESMPDEFTRTVMFEIDLASGTDEEIAESLKSALPQWRKFKGIEENPLESVRFGYGTIKKLINYRIIPMLDILIWAKIKKVRISDDRLSRLLYTDEDEETEMRLPQQIKDTDRPLALKASTIDFIRQLHFFMNKNSHLKDVKVSDVIKLVD